MAEPAARRDAVTARGRPRPRRRPLEPADRRGAARRSATVQRARRGRRRDRPEHPDRPAPPPRARADRRRDALPAAPAADVVRADRRRPRPRLGAPRCSPTGAPAARPTPNRSATGCAARRSRPAGSARPARSSSTAPTPTRRRDALTGSADRPAATPATLGHDGRRALGTRDAGPRPAGRADAPRSSPPSLQGLPPRSVPEVAPTPLQQHYVLLSVPVLICGAIAITALELGASLGSPLVKLCVAHRVRRCSSSRRPTRSCASGARPGRGCRSTAARACSGSPGWPSASIGLAALVAASILVILA